MAKRFDLLVLDWDGTLMDSAGAIVALPSRPPPDRDLETPPEERERHVIGLGPSEALRQYPGWRRIAIH